MIDFITSWTQGIVIAVIVATIIEMILPNGSSKKYIKVVIGIYVLFNIVAPIINKLNIGKIDLSQIVDSANIYSMQNQNNKYIDDEITKQNNSSIKELYITNLKKDMKNKMEEKGYIVLKIDIQTQNNEEYTIKSINLDITKKDKQENEEKTNSIIQINEVNIAIDNEENNIKKENNILDKQINEIKEYLSSIYEVNKNYILVNDK